jgi:glycosyltransferase involved in cell wall biosynthesis
MKSRQMKVALVHDLLTQYGGAESVLEAIVEMFPHAPIYTLIYDSKKMGRSFADKKIITSFLQNKPLAVKKYRWYLPWMPQAIESFDLSQYDLVISDASAFAKGVITLPSTLHICYCHTPTRYLWNDTFEYIKTSKIPWPASMLVSKTINYLRIWDYQSAYRPDLFIANSNYTKSRIKKFYRRKSDIIYPFVEDDRFTYCPNKKQYYLMTGRLVPYKRYDIAIRAFNKMPDKKLIVAGDGVMFDHLKGMIKGDNIVMLGRVSEKKLNNLYQHAKGYIFTADEDFGITPLEAMICGTPVIAFAKGGALETVIDNTTGTYFYNQTADSIIKAISKFEKMNFDFLKISKHARKFSKDNFKKQFTSYINKQYQQYHNLKRS